MAYEMTKEQRDVLRQNKRFILDNLMLNPIFTQSLKSSDRIFDDLVDNSKKSSNVPQEQISTFLDLFPRCGPRAFRYFIKALRASSQDYIADKLLVKINTAADNEHDNKRKQKASVREKVNDIENKLEQQKNESLLHEVKCASRFSILRKESVETKKAIGEKLQQLEDKQEQLENNQKLLFSGMTRISRDVDGVKKVPHPEVVHADTQTVIPPVGDSVGRNKPENHQLLQQLSRGEDAISNVDQQIPSYGPIPDPHDDENSSISLDLRSSGSTTIPVDHIGMQHDTRLVQQLKTEGTPTLCFLPDHTILYVDESGLYTWKSGSQTPTKTYNKSIADKHWEPYDVASNVLEGTVVITERFVKAFTVVRLSEGGKNTRYITKSQLARVCTKSKYIIAEGKSEKGTLLVKYGIDGKFIAEAHLPHNISDICINNKSEIIILNHESNCIMWYEWIERDIHVLVKRRSLELLPCTSGQRFASCLCVCPHDMMLVGYRSGMICLHDSEGHYIQDIINTRMSKPVSIAIHCDTHLAVGFDMGIESGIYVYDISTMSIKN